VTKRLSHFLPPEFRNFGRVTFFLTIEATASNALRANFH
jgi:hypothetical protein